MMLNEQINKHFLIYTSFKTPFLTKFLTKISQVPICYCFKAAISKKSINAIALLLLFQRHLLSIRKRCKLIIDTVKIEISQN